MINDDACCKGEAFTARMLDVERVSSVNASPTMNNER